MSLKADGHLKTQTLEGKSCNNEAASQGTVKDVWQTTRSYEEARKDFPVGCRESMVLLIP